MVCIGNDWDKILENEFNGENYLALRSFLKKEYSSQTIYPSMYDIFNALKFTPFEKVKAVILGQDPYHNEGQAMGLSFSVPNGIDIPPSLKNIYKELESDLGIKPHFNGDLTKWANRGVLLLNTSLTVRANRANSHKGCGWEVFTDEIIKKISDGKKGVVFFLWGSNARSKKPLIDKSKHLILESVHPSPLSAYGGFFGCKHFSKCNEYLEKNGIEKINWDLSL